MTIKVRNNHTEEEQIFKDARSMKRVSSGNFVIEEFSGKGTHYDFTRWEISEVSA